MINGLILKTSPVKVDNNSGLMNIWTILSRDVVPTMDDQADTKETKDAP